MGMSAVGHFTVRTHIIEVSSTLTRPKD
jgi:hypothetical protein